MCRGVILPRLLVVRVRGPSCSVMPCACPVRARLACGPRRGPLHSPPHGRFRTVSRAAGISSMLHNPARPVQRPVAHVLVGAWSVVFVSPTVVDAFRIMVIGSSFQHWFVVVSLCHVSHSMTLPARSAACWWWCWLLHSGLCSKILIVVVSNACMVADLLCVVRRCGVLSERSAESVTVRDCELCSRASCVGDQKTPAARTRPRAPRPPRPRTGRFIYIYISQLNGSGQASEWYRHLRNWLYAIIVTVYRPLYPRWLVAAISRMGIDPISDRSRRSHDTTTHTPTLQLNMSDPPLR